MAILSVCAAEGASEKQSSLKARLRNGLTYLLTLIQNLTTVVCTASIMAIGKKLQDNIARLFFVNE